MRIIGMILVFLYGGLMLFAVCKKKEKCMPNALIFASSAILFVYAFLNLFLHRNYILILLIGMAGISVGALLNGFRQKNVHIHHHLIRLVLEAAITAACWF